MEDDWDNIDWDEKVEGIINTQQNENPTTDKTIAAESTSEFKYSEEDGNYYETNQQKKKLKEQNAQSSKAGHSKKAIDKAIYLQPYSLKDIVRIREFAKSSSSFHNLIYETFGQFERFFLTHQQDLSDDAIVELLNIDVTLLEVPFHTHNEILLKEISKLSLFWSQLMRFIEDFLIEKHNDIKFLLVVDMNGFFENIEFMLHSLIASNLFNSEMELVFKEILKVMENFPGSKWSQPERLKKLLKEYQANQDVFKIYDIYPTLDQLTSSPDNLRPNVVKGEYQNVSDYLQVQIPLLKEDFISKLRDGILELKAKKSIGASMKTPSVWIHTNVQIVPDTRFMWKMKCQVITVNLKTDQKTINWNRRLYDGQMLCFSSSKEFNDLVIAIVMSSGDKKELLIEVIRTENIPSIFNRDLVMIEPVTYFEPYHRVFNVIKNLNELNFPFKNRILKLAKDQKSPSYQQLNCFSYKNYTFEPENLSSWPSSKDLCLEDMQLKAIQQAVTNEFTIIQGPPGTGKTFIGLEILKILLENTNETILILTQTNNALDKFLVGASSFTDSIARMGGQCKAVELESFIVKSTTPFESKKYMNKLNVELGEEMAKLKKDDETHDEVHKKISSHHRRLQEIHQLSAFYSVNQKRVIGMTTTFAARNSSINKMLKPGILIIEEASEVLESHVLVSMTKETKQVIMIGDHQQLRPLTSSYDLSKNFHFNVSLFERLIRNDFNYITLDVQMRMNKDICDLVRGTVYKSLKDGAKVEAYPCVKGMSKNFFCVNHTSPESIGEGETSKENVFEADCMIRLCDHLISKGNSSSAITILTAYAAQAQRIRSGLKGASSTVRVAVLDAYQGEESDIILLSLVRSNNRRDIGFLSSENRIAVVLSRAKFGFYIVANMECLAKASSTWRQVREIMEEKQVIADKFPDVEISFF